MKGQYFTFMECLPSFLGLECWKATVQILTKNTTVQIVNQPHNVIYSGKYKNKYYSFIDLNSVLYY